MRGSTALTHGEVVIKIP